MWACFYSHYCLSFYLSIFNPDLFHSWKSMISAAIQATEHSNISLKSGYNKPCVRVCACAQQYNLCHQKRLASTGKSQSDIKLVFKAKVLPPPRNQTPPPYNKGKGQS